MVTSLAIASVFSFLNMKPKTIALAPQQETVLVEHQFSLDDRYPVPSVNNVFKENILLTFYYMEDKIKEGDKVNWDEVNKPFHYEFSLDKDKTFAFQDTFLPQFSSSVTKTTNAHFNGQEGFLSDGYLYGDGVCHLASFINYTAKDARLDVLAPTNHDFANIPEVPREYGAAIFYEPGALQEDAMQNVYVTNNQLEPIKFIFDYDGHNLKIKITEQSSPAFNL